MKKPTIQKWAHPELQRIWVILQIPDWSDDGPILGEKDISLIEQAVLKLNSDYNKPEIKSLIKEQTK